MRVVIFAVLCYTTPQSSTHQHKPLWRLSGGGREGKREGRHLCSQSSFEDGCYSDQPQICQLMKGRHSAVDGTHTHARARTTFSTCRRRSTASEDAKLTNKLPPLTHTSGLEPMAPPFPQLHYDINQSGNIFGQNSKSKGSLGDIFIKTELLFFFLYKTPESN